MVHGPEVLWRPAGQQPNNLAAEILGDYAFAAATRTYAAAVWNNTRRAADFAQPSRPTDSPCTTRP
jgi:hypothetical protein